MDLQHLCLLMKFINCETYLNLKCSIYEVSIAQIIKPCTLLLEQTLAHWSPLRCMQMCKTRAAPCFIILCMLSPAYVITVQ